MSSINPGRLKSVLGAADPETLMEENLAILTRLLFMLEPSYIDDAPTTAIGSPATGAHEVDEVWTDAKLARWICTADGTPGTWRQISPAIVVAEPSSPPTGYWIVRADQNFKHYTYTGSGFAQLYLPLAGGTMVGKITLDGDPTNSLHAATKAYVDALAGGGVDAKDSCRVATTANLDLATGGELTIDSVVTVAGDRVLVRAQTAGAENGIYVVSAGAWSRSSDADNSSKVTSGLYCFVNEGATYGDMGFSLSTNDPITLNTTALTFVQFSKGLANGEVTDVKIGDRTVDQSLATPADTGSLTSILSWFAGRLKAITGKSDWKTAPAATLEVLSSVTVDQSLASPADTGTPTQMMSWIVGRLKAVTGKADWKTAPAITLEAAMPLAGGTFSGPIEFSGTTNRGVRLVNLTTTQRDALTGVGAGQLIWNTTTGQEEEYTGSAWVGTVGLSLTQTLTNKTLTRPTVTNPAETAQTLTDGATVNWNMDNGGKGTLTLGGNRTMAAPTNLRDGATYVLILKQDGTGTRTVTWNAVFKWAGGTAPTLTTTANATDILTFVSDGTNLYGSILKAFA